MALNPNAAPAATSPLDRDPDFMAEVIEWLDETPKATGMKTKGYGDKPSAPKFLKHAKVRIIGGGALLDPPRDGDVICARAPVTGSAAQWEHHDRKQVEVYRGSDKKDPSKLYFSVFLAEASADIADLELVEA